MTQTWIIIILLIGIAIMYFYQQGREDKYKESYGELERLHAEKLDLEEQNRFKKERNDELEYEYSKWKGLLNNVNNDIQDANNKLIQLDDIATQKQILIEQKQTLIDSGISKLEEEKKNSMELRLAQEQKRLDELLDEARRISEENIAKWTEKAEDARNKYLSIMETLRAEESIEETHMLQIPQNVRDDISYLIESVVPRLNNKEVINKLIWSEYIQNTTKDMLETILPSKECSGIYKITNIETKKSYIGRSTNVYKRLQDHIKSSCGIATIADQKVHHAMRDEGLWNFQFELLEECDKSKLGEREKYYIEFFQTEIYGWNQKAGG